ncbi:MAG: thiamine-binding protein [Ilumatobacter sp.]|uniref:thiamine-binding protein n=1 Tax=Ilumatobacter sp. TaxID=1967498 RepID=UPI00391C47E8
MADAHLEVLVEPFKENDPGPHVLAVVAAIEAEGIDADMGPFATTADGDLDAITEAAAAVVRASLDAGATAIQLRIERT